MSDLVKISQFRIKFLLRHFGMSRKELLHELNSGRKNKLGHADVFADEIKIATLRSIDKVFDFGTSFYFGMLELNEDKKPGILFRKRDKSKALSIVDKRHISKMELEAAELAYYARNSSCRISEKMKKSRISDDPVTTAISLRDELKPGLQSNDKKYLVHLIDLLSENGVLVMEFVDMALTKKNRSRIAGLFFKPNNIVLKRNNLTYKSEIFTLLHELGHYLLNKEVIDIESVMNSGQKDMHMPEEEKWCNEFAFAFLAGNLARYSALDPNDTSAIKSISDKYHISRLAIYMHLRNTGRISAKEYLRWRTATIASSIEDHQAKLQKSRAGSESLGEKLTPVCQRRIISKLEMHICATAYHDGYLDEGDVLNRFEHHDLEAILNAW